MIRILATVVTLSVLALNMGSLSLTSVYAQPVSAQKGSVGKKTAGKLTGKLNLNTATASQLQMLPGIGPSKAERIIVVRKKRAFRRVLELKRVKGIGYKTVKKLSPYLAVKGETTLRKQ